MYTHGIQTCPLAYSKERSILYANRAAAKLKCLVMLLFQEYYYNIEKKRLIFHPGSTIYTILFK